MEILLNEELHQYTVDGTVKANVTSVLESLVKVERYDIYVDTLTGNAIPADMIEQAGDFGRGFHKVAKFVMEGKRCLYPGELKQSKEELVRWKVAEDAVTVASEMKVYCPKLDVCGTMDWIGNLKRNKVLNIVDWKTSKASASMVGPQTFAYKRGYRAMTGYRGIIKRWAWIYDKAKGKFEFVELTDNVGDEHMFRSMNYSYCWKRRA